MRSQEEIENKLQELTEALQSYEVYWEEKEFTERNGIPKNISKDPIYLTINNQRLVLEWVLGDNKWKS